MQLVQQCKKKQEYVSHGGHSGRQWARGIAPLLQVQGSPVVFCSENSTAHCTAITEEAAEQGSFNLPLGIYQPADKTSAKMGKGMSCKVLNSCFS